MKNISSFYGVSEWTKFAVSTLHCVIELSEASNPYFNAALAMMKRWRYRTALRVHSRVDDEMQC